MVKIPKMKDPNIDDYQILKYLQGASTPAETESMLSWLAESEKNRNTYFQLKALWHAYKDNFENDQLNFENSLLAYRARINQPKRISFFSVALSKIISTLFVPNQSIVSNRNIRKN